jgi:PAS domain S-box-containing protein
MSTDPTAGAPSTPFALDAETFRLLVSNIRDHAIILIDINGRIVGWHGGVANMTGYSPSEAIGKHISHFFTPEDIERGWPQHQIDMAKAQGRFEDEGWRVRKDGSRFWASAVITALRDSNRELRGFATLTRDQTEKRRQQDALHQSEERFRSIVEGVSDYAIFTLDPGGNVTSWNAGARRLKGYEPDEIIGLHFSRFYTPEDNERGRPQHLLAMAEAQGHFEDEGWRVRKDGSRFRANVVITALRNAAGDLVGYSKITRDRTERHKREEALTQSEERLREQSEALGDVVQRMRDSIAVVSHELRNSLGPIQLAASLMAKRGLDPTLEHLRQTIDRQSALLTRIVDDLMDLNRGERGHFSIETDPLLLADVLGSAIETSRPLIEARGHALQTQWPREPIAFLGDATRLIQVFVNLLNNAAHYTPIGGQISLLAETTGTDVIVSVADTGKGIPPEMLERVFDPFTQLAPRDRDAHGGLGVGLALARRIIELHGGTINALSQGVLQGSKFVVTLPLMEPDTRPVPEVSEQAVAAPHTVRVLCVDDNQDLVNSLARLLQAMGHKTQVAYDGATALGAAQTLQPEVVLLDIDMPGMNGFEVARRLLEQQVDAPPRLVALTGWARESDKQRAQDAGFYRYIVKPVTHKALESLLQDLPLGGTNGSAAPSTT